MLIAAILAIQLHGLSYHFGDGYSDKQTGQRMQYRETNIGLGLRYETSPAFAIQVGGYRNSYRKNSGYAAIDWTPVSVMGTRVGIFAGMVSGYPYLSRVAPGGGLSIRKDFADSNVIIRLIPPAGRKVDGAVAVEAGVRF